MKFEIYLEEIAPGISPLHRFMSPYEQKKEIPDSRYKYLLIAAEPYTTIAFKIPNKDLDLSEGNYSFKWDKEKKLYSLLITFKDNDGENKPIPNLPT